MLDEALIAWEKQPTSEAGMSAMLATVIGGMAKRDGQEIPEEDRPKTIMDKAATEGKQRERQSLLLRAKLAQASARASEHEFERT